MKRTFIALLTLTAFTTTAQGQIIGSLPWADPIPDPVGPRYQTDGHLDYPQLTYQDAGPVEDNWVNVEKSVTLKDDMGNVVERTYSHWNASANNWQAVVTYASDWTYNTLLLPDKIIYELALDGINQKRTATYQYGVSGNVIQADYLDSLKIAEEPFAVKSRELIVWDNNRMESRTLQQEIPIFGGYTDYMITEFTYNAQGYVQSAEVSIMGEDFEWMPTAREDYVYVTGGQAGLVEQYLTYSWDPNNGWAGINRESYRYTPEDAFQSITRDTADTGGVWHPETRTLLTYLEDDRLDNIIEEYYDGDWTEDTKSLMNYGATTVLQMVYIHHWMGSNWAVAPASRIVVNDATPLPDKRRKDGIAIYPNPATDFLTIADLTSGGHLIISDMAGKVITTQQLAPGLNTIEVQNLKPGLYIANLITEDGRESLPILVE